LPLAGVARAEQARPVANTRQVRSAGERPTTKKAEHRTYNPGRSSRPRVRSGCVRTA